MRINPPSVKFDKKLKKLLQHLVKGTKISRASLLGRLRCKKHKAPIYVKDKNCMEDYSNDEINENIAENKRYFKKLKRLVSKYTFNSYAGNRYPFAYVSSWEAEARRRFDAATKVIHKVGTFTNYWRHLYTTLPDLHTECTKLGAYINELNFDIRIVIIPIRSSDLELLKNLIEYLLHTLAFESNVKKEDFRYLYAYD